MARHVDRLSALLVKSLSSPGYYGDGNGLVLQVAAAGSTSWIFRFSKNGKRREMGLGPVHTVSLAMAREKALACRRLLAAGIDPIADRNSSRTSEALSRARAKTFDQCAAAYINAHRGSWKSAKHAAQWESTLATYVSPVFGSTPVADVDTEIVMNVLRPIWGIKTETAVRLRGRIESILDWATVSKYRQGENPADGAVISKTFLAICAPDFLTLPDSTYPTLSCFAISFKSIAIPLNLKLEWRVTTENHRKRDSALMMSSVIPSAKYSCSASPL